MRNERKNASVLRVGPGERTTQTERARHKKCLTKEDGVSRATTSSMPDQ